MMELPIVFRSIDNFTAQRLADVQTMWPNRVSRGARWERHVAFEDMKLRCTSDIGLPFPVPYSLGIRKWSSQVCPYQQRPSRLRLLAHIALPHFADFHAGQEEQKNGTFDCSHPIGLARIDVRCRAGKQE
jgi:hypothetical protein